MYGTEPRYIEDIAQPREETNFIFEWQNIVFNHSKIKFKPTFNVFFLLYRQGCVCTNNS